MAANIVEIFKDHKFSVDSDQVSAQLIYCLIPSLLPSISFAKEQLSIYKNLLESDFGLKNPFVLGIRTVLQKTGTLMVFIVENVALQGPRHRGLGWS